jgi:hypothetical protein
LPFRPVWAILARGFSGARGWRTMPALIRGPERLETVAAWRHRGRSATPWPNESRGILCKSGEWLTRNMRG